MVISEKLIDETETRLARNKFRKYLSEDEAQQWVDALCIIGHWVDDRPENEIPSVCADPDDNYLVALYQDSEAHFLVSGDKAVLAIDYPRVHVRSVNDVFNDIAFEHDWGPGLVRGAEGEAFRDVAAEGNQGIFSAYSTFINVIDSPDAENLLPMIVVPETVSAFVSSIVELRAMLSDRGLASRPEFASPEVAYLKLPPNPGDNVWAMDPMYLPADTIFATMVRCSDIPPIDGTDFDGWRVFGIGQPVPIQQIPPRPETASGVA